MYTYGTRRNRGTRGRNADTRQRLNSRQRPRSRHRGKTKNMCMSMPDVSTQSINTIQTRHCRGPNARRPTSIPPCTYHHAGNEPKQDSIHQLVEHLTQHHPAQGCPKQLGHARQGGPEERLRFGPRRVVNWHGNGNALRDAAEQKRRYGGRENEGGNGEGHMPRHRVAGKKGKQQGPALHDKTGERARKRQQPTGDAKHRPRRHGEQTPVTQRSMAA